MKLRLSFVLAAGMALGSAHAQEPVTPAPNPDALFHSSDPKLNANKQVVYHIVKDLLEAGHWEMADKYMTDRYIQHNPNFPSGRDGVAKAMMAMRKPQPIPEKMNSKVIAVTADGDMVVVAQVQELTDRASGQPYTTTTFDMWRIKDGRADEHWDPAMKGPPPGGPGMPPPPPGGPGMPPPGN